MCRELCNRIRILIQWNNFELLFRCNTLSYDWVTLSKQDSNRWNSNQTGMWRIMLELGLLFEWAMCLQTRLQWNILWNLRLIRKKRQWKWKHIYDNSPYASTDWIRTILYFKIYKKSKGSSRPRGKTIFTVKS